MPGTDAEKRQLIEEITRAYSTFFGVPTRQALIAQWWRSSLQEIHHIAGKWRALLKRCADKGITARDTLPPLAVAPEEAQARESKWRELFPGMNR